ncbi:MAG: serine/threonine-protein kinase [Pseudonocardia sp.]
MTVDSLIGGRYQLDEQVSAGGMGAVWRATDELLGRRVAIKHIRLDRLDGGSAGIIRRRTLRKTRVAARLRHPHIVSILDVLTVAGDPWLVLEYLPSERLSDAIARGTLTPWQAAGIGAGIADALAVAHAAGILHCDVNPGNLLLSRTGEVKLTGFGVVRVAGDATRTGPGLIIGTPAYLAPEVCHGEQSGTAGDIYSLGATLYAAVEGAPPFGDGHGDTRHPTRLVDSGQAHTAERAGPLAPVLQWLLHHDPVARPDAVTARELLRQVAGSNTASPVPVGPIHAGRTTQAVPPTIPTLPPIQ